MTARRRARPGATGAMLDAVEQWSYLGLGAARAVVESAGEPASRRAPRGGRGRSRRKGAPPGIGDLLPGALLGLTLTAQHHVFDAVAEAEVKVQAALARAGDNPAVSAATQRLTEFLAEWDARFRAEQDASLEQARTAAARLAPALADAIMAELDVGALIDQVDMDAVVERMPVEALLDRINLRGVIIEALVDVQVAELLQEGTLLATSTLEALRELGGGATRLATRGLRRGR